MTPYGIITNYRKKKNVKGVYDSKSFLNTAKWTAE